MTMALSMSALLFIVFFFILSVILLAKWPKAGAVFAGVTLLVGLIGLFQTRAHMGMGFPGIIILAPFIFVLLVLMLVKAPKAGVGIAVALVLVGVVGFFASMPVTRDRVAPIEETVRIVPSVGARHASPLPDATVTDSVDWQPVNPQPAVISPIWSEGVENEYEADMYPSRKAAVRALGARLQEWIQLVAQDASEPIKIVLFQDQWERSVLWELEQALERAVPGMACTIEPGHRNIGWDEIGITLQFEIGELGSAPWADRGESPMVSGRAVANARHRERQINVVQGYVEKPWVEDFAGFSNTRPDRQFIIARSQGACTSENEAKQQAEADACAQVALRLDGVRPVLPGQSPPTVSPADLLGGGFVLDLFVQSFDGLSGRLWRHAVLIDASPEKLARLEQQKNVQVRVERVTWAGGILSAFGVLVIILVTYLFLNMATRGYYVWSLRIAGTVLAIAAIVSIILIL